MKSKKFISLALVFFSSVFQPLAVAAVSPVLKLQVEDLVAKVGEELKVEIYLDPLGQPTVGTDIFLVFDPSFLEVKKIDCGSFYPHCPAKIFDQEHHLIKIAGSANFKTYPSTAGVLASILLEAKKEGSSRIDFVWRKGATNETNVVSPEKKDLLDYQPEGIELEIKSSSGTEALTLSPSPEPSSFATMAGLVETQAIVGNPPLIQRVTQVIEKIKEKISPQKDEIISPLPQESFPPRVLGSKEASLPVKIPWLPLASLVLLTVLFIALSGKLSSQISFRKN